MLSFSSAACKKHSQGWCDLYERQKTNPSGSADFCRAGGEEGSKWASIKLLASKPISKSFKDQQYLNKASHHSDTLGDVKPPALLTTASFFSPDYFILPFYYMIAFDSPSSTLRHFTLFFSNACMPPPQHRTLLLLPSKYQLLHPPVILPGGGIPSSI